MASGNDIKYHTATYEGFLTLLKWATPIAGIITAGVIFLISR